MYLRGVHEMVQDVSRKKNQKKERERICENYNTVHCLCALVKLPHPFLVHKDTNLISDLIWYLQLSALSMSTFFSTFSSSKHSVAIRLTGKNLQAM